MVSFSWLPLVGRTIACPTAVLLIWVEAKNKTKQKRDVSIAAFCYFQWKVGEGNLVANSMGFPAQHAGIGVSYLEEPSIPDISGTSLVMKRVNHSV